MSIHSEVQNLLKNKSGNSPLVIRSRSGDTEDGNAYFDMRASTAPSALEVLEEKDSRAARQKFLCAYFTLLKQWLNRFEFEYVKQLYVEGQDENTVFDMLGLRPKLFKRNMQAKLAEHTGEVQELVERSEWEDAELFSKCFLSSPSEILRDKELVATNPKTVKGFGNLIKARSRRENYLQANSDRAYQRRVYMRGFMAGKYAALHPRFEKRAKINGAYKVRAALKERFDNVFTMLRILSYDFLKGAREGFGVQLDIETTAGFERFYRSIYDELTQNINFMFQLIVDDIPLEEVEQVEAERRAAKLAEEDEPAGAAV